MLPVSPDRHISQWDLARPFAGRQDEPELVDICWRYLVERQDRELRPEESEQSQRRANAEVVSARILAAAKSSVSTAELSRRLGDAEATIDRLLAFVPTRSALIGSDRLRELSLAVAKSLETVLPKIRRIESSISPETEVDTDACHRIAILVLHDSLAEADEMFAKAEIAAHRALAVNSNQAELQSVRLIVDVVESVD
jgi:hypothetical protein